MYEQRSGPHPLFIVGIFIFVAPMVDFILPFDIPKWIGYIGFIMLIVGAVISMFKN